MLEAYVPRVFAIDGTVLVSLHAASPKALNPRL